MFFHRFKYVNIQEKPLFLLIQRSELEQNRGAKVVIMVVNLTTLISYSHASRLPRQFEYQAPGPPTPIVATISSLFQQRSASPLRLRDRNMHLVHIVLFEWRPDIHITVVLDVSSPSPSVAQHRGVDSLPRHLPQPPVAVVGKRLGEDITPILLIDLSRTRPANAC